MNVSRRRMMAKTQNRRMVLQFGGAPLVAERGLADVRDLGETVVCREATQTGELGS